MMVSSWNLYLGLKAASSTSLSISSKLAMLWFKDLRVSQRIEPCIRLTQENLIENSVQDSLPYILNPHGPC